MIIKSNPFFFSKRAFVFGILSLIISCGPPTMEEFTKNLPFKLRANSEVHKAITHFKTKGESKKTAALLFLLKNMEGHFGLSNILSEKYDSILMPKEYGYEIPNTADKNGIVLKRLISMEEKYGKIKPVLTKIRYDINSLSADYLIENINWAFKVWEKAPWAKNISFDDFCEHILPYRADQEPMHKWREMAFDNFKWVINNNQKTNLTEACAMINDSIKNVLSNMIEMSLYPVRLTYDRMHTFKVGICEDETAFATLAMRGVGLPVGIDFVPQWPWRSMGHSWNYLLLEDGATIPFMGTETNPGVPHFEKEKKGKVYRKTFSKQKKSLAEIESDHSKIPTFFRSPYFKDVTDLYVKTHDISVSLKNTDATLGKYVYLSVFDNQKWEPIDWALQKENQVTFKNIQGGIVYLPKYYKNQQFVHTENPIILEENGTVKSIEPNFEKTETLTLKRKYPLSKHMDDYLKNMIGGRFEVSNNADFKEAIVIRTIENKPETYLRSLQNKRTTKKYKYIRYVASKKDSGRCNLAIFNAFTLKKGKEIKLNGKIIGTKGSFKGYGAEKQKAFDNDPSTFFDAPEIDWGKAWIGLEFDKPIQISKIDFMPRNDTNTIFEGQEYELFYWNKGWRGMGKEIANTTEKITFKNVPTNALYLLHNHSGGKEERIFTWNKGHVKWY